MSTEIVVTRAGQITLTKDIREKTGISEGDTVVINTLGKQVVISKKDPKLLAELPSFLPKNFFDVLKKIRETPEKRLKKLGILP